jgi:hypothetical protein
MKTFEVIFIKTQNIIGKHNAPTQLAKQLIQSDLLTLEIPVPTGYSIVSICEIMEPKTITNNKLNEIPSN